jgi:hypothetical protein
LPNDHARTLIEFLRAGSPDLTRRWVSALLLVPEHERLAVVQAVEQRIVETYAPAGSPAFSPSAGDERADAADTNDAVRSRAPRRTTRRGSP